MPLLSRNNLKLKAYGHFPARPRIAFSDPGQFPGMGHSKDFLQHAQCSQNSKDYAGTLRIFHSMESYTSERSTGKLLPPPEQQNTSKDNPRRKGRKQTRRKQQRTEEQRAGRKEGRESSFSSHFITFQHVS